MHVQPLQIPDESADDSDPADDADDAANDNNTTLPQFKPRSPSPPPQTHLIAVKSVCFKNVKMWLWCRAGILDSVAVAQTLSHPWTCGCPICRTPIRMVLRRYID